MLLCLLSFFFNCLFGYSIEGVFPTTFPPFLTTTINSFLSSEFPETSNRYFNSFYEDTEPMVSFLSDVVGDGFMDFAFLSRYPDTTAREVFANGSESDARILNDNVVLTPIFQVPIVFVANFDGLVAPDALVPLDMATFAGILSDGFVTWAEVNASLPPLPICPIFPSWPSTISLEVSRVLSSLAGGMWPLPNGSYTLDMSPLSSSLCKAVLPGGVYSGDFDSSFFNRGASTQDGLAPTLWTEAVIPYLLQTPGAVAFLPLVEFTRLARRASYRSPAGATQVPDLSSVVLFGLQTAIGRKSPLEIFYDQYNLIKPTFNVLLDPPQFWPFISSATLMLARSPPSSQFGRCQELETLANLVSSLLTSDFFDEVMLTPPPEARNGSLLLQTRGLAPMSLIDSALAVNSLDFECAGETLALAPVFGYLGTATGVASLLSDVNANVAPSSTADLSGGTIAEVRGGIVAQAQELFTLQFNEFGDPIGTDHFEPMLSNFTGIPESVTDAAFAAGMLAGGDIVRIPLATSALGVFHNIVTRERGGVPVLNSAVNLTSALVAKLFNPCLLSAAECADPAVLLRELLALNPQISAGRNSTGLVVVLPAEMTLPGMPWVGAPALAHFLRAHGSDPAVLNDAAIDLGLLSLDLLAGNCSCAAVMHASVSEVLASGGFDDSELPVGITAETLATFTAAFVRVIRSFQYSRSLPLFESSAGGGGGENSTIVFFLSPMDLAARVGIEYAAARVDGVAPSYLGLRAAALRDEAANKPLLACGPQDDCSAAGAYPLAYRVFTMLPSRYSNVSFVENAAGYLLGLHYWALKGGTAAADPATAASSEAQEPVVSALTAAGVAPSYPTAGSPGYLEAVRQMLRVQSYFNGEQLLLQAPCINPQTLVECSGNGLCLSKATQDGGFSSSCSCRGGFHGAFCQDSDSDSSKSSLLLLEAVLPPVLICCCLLLCGLVIALLCIMCAAGTVLTVTVVVFVVILVVVLSLTTAAGIAASRRIKKLSRDIDLEDLLRAHEVSQDDYRELHAEDIVFSKRIGEGAYGVVYLGRWLGAQVAVKELRVTRTLSHEALEELRHEARIMTKAGVHPNIVAFIGAVTPHATAEDPSYLLITEYCAGGALSQLLASQATTPLPPRRALHFALEAARGLTYLHSVGIIHRDIAARNCLLTGEGVLKLSDFGSSRLVFEGAATAGGVMQTRTTVGPVRWMAPESLSRREYSEGSDVYMLAVLFWEIAHRSIPFAGKSVSEVARVVEAGTRPDIDASCCPDVMASLMRRCWLQDPANRPRARAIVEELEQELEGTGGIDMRRKEVSDRKKLVQITRKLQKSGALSLRFPDDELTDPEEEVSSSERVTGASSKILNDGAEAQYVELDQFN